MSNPTFVFATRKAEITFWKRALDKLDYSPIHLSYFVSYPQAQNIRTCPACLIFGDLYMVIEDRVIALMNPTT